MLQSAFNVKTIIFSSKYKSYHFNIDLPQLRKVGVEVLKDSNISFSHIQNIIVDSKKNVLKCKIDVNEESYTSIQKCTDKVYYVS